MSRIPFQVSNSANSATFPRSRKITGPMIHTQAFREVTRAQRSNHVHSVQYRGLP